MALKSSRFTGWVVRHKERIKTIGIGLVAYESFNLIYDYPFYLFAISYWGIVTGGIIAVAGSLITNIALFWAYDRFKIDWLGAYALRELEAKENKNRFERLAVWIGKANKTWWEVILTSVAFVLLLVRVDPLIVAVHFQQQHFNGLKAKDWGILLTAVIVGNGWWLIQTGLFVEVMRFLWRQFFT